MPGYMESGHSGISRGVLKAWPCKRSWDYVAMDSVTREGCKLVALHRTGHKVTEVETTGGVHQADAVVVATGAWTPQLAA